MARCTHCGKVNRDDSLFCQECGQRLEAPRPTPAPSPTTVNCSSCGAANVEGMNFCKMCGTPLTKPAPAPVAKAAPAPVATAPAASDKQTCASCGKLTPAGFAFCQHCGRRFDSTESRNLGVASTMAADGNLPTPTPPAGMPAAAKPRATGNGNANPNANANANNDAWASTVAAGISLPGTAPNSVPPAALTPASGSVFAQPSSPAQPAFQSRSSSPAMPSFQPPPVSSPVMSNPLPQLAFQQSPSNAGNNGGRANPAATARAFAEAPATGRLVPLNRDGSSGRAMPLPVGVFDIGRTEGDLQFSEDSFLAELHARLQCDAGSIVCQPIDLVNGVFLRLRHLYVLTDGDTLLVGRQLLRFDVIPPSESQQPTVVQHGVRRFGSAERAPWARLRQLTTAGTTLDVWHLTRSEMTLGREEGDLTFSDDEFMSRKHTLFRHDGSRFSLEDLGSSNGTFVRLRGPTAITPGDVLRVGDQLLRLEA